MFWINGVLLFSVAETQKHSKNIFNNHFIMIF